MDYYREAEVNKFVYIGATTVVVLAMGFWGLRTYALQGLKQDDLEAPWVLAARHEPGSPRPRPQTLGAPDATQEHQQRLARWHAQSEQPRRLDGQ